MFAYEIQTSFAPGMTWLRSPYPRKDWERAFEEGQTYCKFAWEYRGEVCAVRVVKVADA